MTKGMRANAVYMCVFMYVWMLHICLYVHL